jgi:hypothetical protein
MELRKEVAQLREQLAVCRDAEDEKRLYARLHAAELKYHILMERHSRRAQKL